MPTPPLSREKIEAAQRAYDEQGTEKGAAEALGLSRSAVRNRLQQGQRPPLEPVGEGYEVRGVSTLVDADGQVKGQWIKTAREADRRLQAAQEAVEALKAGVPRVTPEKPPQRTQDDLCACYVLTDAHLGCLAWGEETRSDDWDTDIAEQTVMRWFGQAIETAPQAHTGILAQLGDLLHHDGLESVTPTSHNVLDADTRFQRLVRIAVRVLRHSIGLMLKKHQHVHVVMAEGNHDQASSVWLREVFAALFEDEPRVTVDTSPDPYYVVEWGRTMIGFHHGHKVKMPELSKALVGKFPEVYGRTQYRYGHAGHLHHVEAKEDQLMILEQHPTLAARDAHASRLGYINQRGANVITYHRESGEVARSTIRPEMIG